MTTKPDWSISEYFLFQINREEYKKRRNRNFLVIAATIFVLVLIFASLFLAISKSGPRQSANSPQSISSSLPAESSALAAFDIALPRALDWKSDALLLKATATWSQGADRESLLDGSEIWSFRFLSEKRNKTANLTVMEAKARLLNQAYLDPNLQPTSIEGWNIDSKTAILRLLDEGGESFLNENNVSSLTMSLTAGAERGRPEWLLSVFGEEASNYFNMRIDASNGEVLDIFQSP